MFWLYSFHVNPLLSSSGRQRENSGSTSTTSTLSPSRLDNDINFSPNWSHRDIRDPVSVTRPNRWPTWHWHWWELETYILCFVMIGCDLCPPVVINAGLPAVIALLERVVNRKGQIQSLRNIKNGKWGFIMNEDYFHHQILVQVRYGVVQGLGFIVFSAEILSEGTWGEAPPVMVISRLEISRGSVIWGAVACGVSILWLRIQPGAF